jgi:hypothetical protein
MTQDVLATLTRAQREAVREMVARAWIDGDSDERAPSGYIPSPTGLGHEYARLALPEPKVTRPRVERFGREEYCILEGEMRWRRLGEHDWRPAFSGPSLLTRGCAARWLALWDNPTEEVPVDA